jgi:orotidine-5'-phosphate decarboxylase
MMKEAVRRGDETASELGTKRPKLIGIALLTSMSQQSLNEEIGVPGTVADEVIRLGRMASKAGLDGIVCSAAELPEVKAHLPATLEYVTPGVRPAGADHDDHQRVVSYADAVSAGSNLLVVGRTIFPGKFCNANPATAAAQEPWHVAP